MHLSAVHSHIKIPKGISLSATTTQLLDFFFNQLVICLGSRTAECDWLIGGLVCIQGDHCLENLEMSENLEHVRDVVNSQGIVRGKILSWKSVSKLFITR